MTIKIEKINGDDPRLPVLIGKFAMNPDVLVEFQNYPIITKPHWKWLVAFDDSAEVIGFCAYYRTKTTIIFENDYVTPNFRNRGIYRELNMERMKCLDAEPFDKIYTLATHASTHQFENMGFVTVKPTTNFNKMVYKSCN